ncbi:NAD-dependent epimerase/dehydratase family protein [Achromobacter xylosoxidans]|uniref:NAD-dependent epimerase/dehydratase family protein n=1 Tax=Alcaligenes xylosoxydans xylosoxydans TaxID=85698 RepID=UPI003EE3863E
MHILISGASGFVGMAAVRYFTARGHKVTAIVRSPGTADADDELVWDISRQAQPERLPDDVDAVVHLAQSRNYRAFPGDVDEMFRVNVVGAQNLLALAQRLGVSRFCLMSTGSVYEPYAGNLNEQDLVRPAGYLGASKAAAEVLAHAYSAHFPISTLRLFFPYGPHQRQRLIPDLARRVARGEAIQLGADALGLAITPIYVDDVCQIIQASLDQAWRGIVNVASPEVLTIRDIATTFGTALGKEPVFEVTDRPSPRIVPDTQKLLSLMPGMSFTPFSAGAGQLVRSGV